MDTGFPDSAHEPLHISASHRELLDQVLDKWSVHVMSELCGAPRRFNELRRAIPDVSQKSLTNTLRRLERNGMIRRELISSRPVAVQYSVSPLGKTMREPIEALLRWLAEQTQAIKQARDQFDDETF